MLPSMIALAARAIRQRGSTQHPEPAIPPVVKSSYNPARFLPVLMLLFGGSGMSALIYEIVWYQLLQLAIGSTAVSLGILLATFMGGLGLGSWLLPRVVPAGGSNGRRPLMLYAAIEAGIAVFGVIELILIPFIEQVYVASVNYGPLGMALRALTCATVLLPPTVLMGASLPAIARWVRATPRGVSWWGFLYGINTAGAVIGCVTAGFYLMPQFDTVVATAVAVSINALVAVVSFLAAKSLPADSALEWTASPGHEGLAATEHEPASVVSIYLAVGISGACAMGAQIIWTRNMGLMLGATVYAFSNILAAFLVGLGAGAGLGALGSRGRSPRVALGWCQILAVFGIAWSAYNISTALPNWPIDTYDATSPVYVFQIDFLRALWAILPPTLIWGASVPLAFGAAARSVSKLHDSARTVGRVYAANTLGAIIGALAASLVLVPYLGSQSSQRILMALSVLGGVVALWEWLVRGNALDGALTTVSIAAAIWAVMGIGPVPGTLIAWGRRTAVLSSTATMLESAEGVNSSFAFSRDVGSGAVQFHVGGRVEASDAWQDMRMERMLGHLPALVTQPKTVLVVGFGAGVTAGTFTLYPTVERIVICEMEPKIPPMSTHYFAPQNYDVLHDPRTRVFYDDARHFVLTSTDKFDLITSDPIHPFVKGSASLYSREYFEMVRAHLNPNGIVTQWVPLYETDTETVKSEIATFVEVFPRGQIFANLSDGFGYDVVLMARADGAPIDIDSVANRLVAPEYARVAQSLLEVGFSSGYQLFGTFASSSADVRRWLAGAAINHDKDLRLQYLAGLALNQQTGDDIFRQILRNRVWPSQDFTGSDAGIAMLTEVLVR
jgi:spermidine synthase